MNRKEFLTSMALLPLTGKVANLQTLSKITEDFGKSDRYPVLFLGHGSPMNAIEVNEFVQGFRNISKTFEKPKAVLCISAHWETKGTNVTAMPSPPTIHDFGGFPQQLYDVQYPAPGSPDLAVKTQSIINTAQVGLDYNWGLDHGAWSVIKHLYPNADVPVIQMSIDYTKPPQYHYDLSKQLVSLRSQGVLIIGSGNIVHNLGMIAWDKFNVDNYSYDWALEASDKIKTYIENGNHESLVHYQKQGKAFQLAIPSPEHYLPLIYSLALQDKDESIKLFNDKAVAGSLTMTSVKIG